MKNDERPPFHKEPRGPILWAINIVAIYVGVSIIAFALRHPELTDTQRLLRILDALLWR